ncbi:MAG: hypothetical protein LIQ30_13520 [Planctomycetes bacterium]|nr:hypothetical protein [Planctomycetota bacterium]
MARKSKRPARASKKAGARSRVPAVSSSTATPGPAGQRLDALATAGLLLLVALLVSLVLYALEQVKDAVSM